MIGDPRGKEDLQEPARGAPRALGVCHQAILSRYNLSSLLIIVIRRAGDDRVPGMVMDGLPMKHPSTTPRLDGGHFLNASKRCVWR